MCGQKSTDPVSLSGRISHCLMIYSGWTPTVSYSADPDGSFVATGLALTLSGRPIPDMVTQRQAGLQ